VNHTYVVLKVRNVGRPVAVDGIHFELQSPEAGAQGLVWGSPNPECLLLTHFRPLPSLLGGSVLIGDGDTETWSFTLDISPYFGQMRPFKAVAIVELSTGKRIRSEPFPHWQSPDAGWVNQVGESA
jgi:hypothetical protein